MRLIADLHLHSPYSRAVSPRLSPSALVGAARAKGLDIIGTGDASHPAWLERLEGELLPAEEGLFALREEAAGGRSGSKEREGALFDAPRFILSTEVSTIYRTGGRTRRVHHLILLPGFQAARDFRSALQPHGSLGSDGRPSLRLDSRDLLELLLESEPHAILIPAHIWTPWYSVLGAGTGFDSIEECYRDLAQHIGAVETGLSSDPPMNRAVSSLDGYALVSNSDAHSADRLGREATVFEAEPSYAGIADALSGAAGGPRGSVVGTIELFPEEGKYYWDGHRDCGVSRAPEGPQAGIRPCPVCGKPLTLGVLGRVLALADRDLDGTGQMRIGLQGGRPGNAASGSAPRYQPGSPVSAFERLVPLRELLGEILRVRPESKRVTEIYEALLRQAGSELRLLRELSPEEAAAMGTAAALALRRRSASPASAWRDPGPEDFGTALGTALARVRAGEVCVEPGYDGRYGRVRALPEPGA